MNLNDQANYVITQVGLSGTTNLAAAQLFIRNWDEQVYNSYLWKDSLIGVDYPFNPGNPDNLEGVVLTPPVIDIVAAARVGSAPGVWGNSLRIHGMEDYYRVDWDWFQQQGTPCEFAEMSPVWFIFRGGTGLQLVNANIADSSTTANPLQSELTYYDENNVKHVVLAAPGAQFLSVGAPARLVIESLFCPATVGGMSLMQIAASILPSGGGNYGSSNPNEVDVATVAGQQYFVMTGANEVGTTFNNGTQAQPIIAAGQSFLFTAQWASVSFVSAASAAVFTGSVTPATIVSTVGAGLTRSVSSQRLRLMPTPSAAMPIKILGKMAYVPMTFPYHEPIIKASSQCTMAFAVAALLKRERQYAKADMEEKKAGGLLLECAKLHSIQRTNNQRFIPEGGYGLDFGGPTRFGVFGGYQ